MRRGAEPSVRARRLGRCPHVVDVAETPSAARELRTPHRGPLRAGRAAARGGQRRSAAA
ncbi:hypothetical protein Y09_0621 [Brachybacterium sp. SW0106-09]|nr:hypothetical protein Y09_0621 [Brachybacterium sp. SW0106-09]